MAALGQWETDWQDSIKATILLGSDKFIKKMLGVLRGDRREQTGLRLKERLSVDWGNIVEAITDVWDQRWGALANSRGNGALPATFFLGSDMAAYN
jgi:hypothetical protein